MHKIKKYLGGTNRGGIAPPQQNQNSTFMPTMVQQLGVGRYISDWQMNQTAPLSKPIAPAFDIPSINNTTKLSTIETPKASTPKSGGLSKGLGAIGGLFGSISDAIPSADKDINSTDATMSNIRSTANKALMSSGNPFAMAAGAINTVIDKTGGFTDASKGLGKADTWNSIASLALPGFGWFTGKTEKYKMSDTLKNASGYTGTADDAQTAQGNANAKLLFGRSKAKNMIQGAKQKDLMVQDITKEATDRFSASNSPMFGIKTAMDLQGGYKNTQIGREGLKLDREFAARVVKRNVILHSEGNLLITPEEIKAFKEGGAINVIPEGALHAHKHNLTNVDEKFEEVTTKGIPVITQSEGGDITQHAEVERNEIIFCLEVTQKIEKLMKEDTDDAAIEAGKLLVFEILENTEDNTGLLEEID